MHQPKKLKWMSKNIIITGTSRGIGFELVHLFAKAGQKDVWQFVNKFSIFVNSGIDIKWALWILIKQSKNPLIKKIVIEMRRNIDHWVSIHETMLQYPKVFDSLTTALIEVGEKKENSFILTGKNEKITVYEHFSYKIETVNNIMKKENLTIMEVYEKYFTKISPLLKGVL